MLHGRIADYLQLLSGGVLLLAGGVVAWVAAPRSRAAKVAAAVALLALLLWANAPYTGITKNAALAVGAVRYLLPAMAAATLALCVAGRDARAARWLAWGVFGLSALVSAARTWQLGFPYVPALSTIVALTVAGGALTMLARRLPRTVARAGAVALPLLLIAGAAGSTDGFVRRHTDSGLPDGGLLRALERARVPETEDVLMAPATVALVRGDTLGRRVDLVPATTPCARLRGRFVVLQRTPPTPEYDRLSRCMRGDRPAWSDATYELHVP
jgi:hypothetical protein